MAGTSRFNLGSKSPFRTATLWLIWGWLLIFALLPNILVIAVSFLTRDSSAFISLPVSIDSYIRMVDPLYFEVFAPFFMDGGYHHDHLLIAGLSFCLADIQSQSALAALANDAINPAVLDQLSSTDLCAQITICQ